MKTKLFFLFSILFFWNLTAQNIVFQDAVFKSDLVNKLCTESYPFGGFNAKVDSNGDGEIQVSEAESVTALGLNNFMITNIGEISYFKNLERLYIYDIGISMLDLHQNTKLKLINAFGHPSGNTISEINLTGLNSLSQLDLRFCSFQSLDLSNLPALTEVYLNTNETSQINLQNLSQLYKLSIISNKITQLDLSALTNLQYLTLNGNPYTEVSVLDLQKLLSAEIRFNPTLQLLKMKNLPLLETLDCHGNSLSAIQFENLPSLKTLQIEDNKLTTLDLSNFSNLTGVLCFNNLLTNLTLNNLTKLASLFASNNQLTTVNLTGLSSMINLDLSKNLLSEVSLQNMPLVNSVSLGNNKLSAINLQGLDQLYTLHLNDNQFSTISFPPLPSLKVLNLENNLLQQLDYANLKQINSLKINNNLLTSLNFSDFPVLNYVECKKNKLEFLSVKNNISTTTYFSENPNLKYICCDSYEVSTIQNNLDSSQINNVNINTYCSYTPGGNFNTISGNIKIDFNNNGCNLEDRNYADLVVELKNSDGQSRTVTNTDGNYSFYTDSGNFTVTPKLQNLNYYTISPSSATVNFTDNNNHVITKNFCIVPNGIRNDLEVQFAPISVARPGFESSYRMIYLNKGNTILSGTVNLNYQGNKITFLSSDVPPSSNTNSNLVWNFTDLKPFEQKSFIVTFKLNPPTHPTDPLNSGDKLTFTAKIFPVNNDETPKDNNLVLHQTVVNAVDPNDKTCLQGDVITPDLVGTDLHYLIRFENTGTANAVNIVVKDLIDVSKFDIATLQPIKSSHPYRMMISETNKVEFFYENIQLPFDDANNDGYILFKIKTLPTVKVGDVMKNSADIYFDYNFPIATNQTSTVVQEALSTTENGSSALRIYPNPVKDLLHIETLEKIKKIEIHDVSGKLIEVRINSSSKTFDLKNLKPGFYILKAITQNHQYQNKFIKN